MSMGEQLRRDMAKYLRSDPEYYGRYGEVEIKKLRVKIPDDHICLGVSSPDEDAEPVTFKWDGESIRMFMIAPTGIGKTTFLKAFVIDQLRRRFGMPTLVIDPKATDYNRLNVKQTDNDIIERLNICGFTPEAYNPTIIKPRCLMLPDERIPRNTLPFKLNINDFFMLERAFSNSSLNAFFDVEKKTNATGRALNRVLNMIYNPSEIPQQFKGRKIDTMLFFDLIKYDIDILGNNPATKRNVTHALQMAAETRKNELALGDDDNVNILQEMNDNMVILKIGANVGKNITLNVMGEILLGQIFMDRQRFSQNERHVLESPPVIALDEGDTVLRPIKQFSPMKDMFQELVMRGRQHGISVFMTGLDPELLDKHVLQQCQYIVTAKPIMPAQKQILTNWGVTPDVMEDLLKLELSKDNRRIELAMLTYDTITHGEFYTFYGNGSLTTNIRESQQTTAISIKSDRT